MLLDVFQSEALDPKIMLQLTYIFWTRWFSTCSFIAFCFAGSHLLVNNMCLTHLLSIYATASCLSFCIVCKFFCIVCKFLNLWYVFKSLWNLILFLIKESFTRILAGAALASLYFHCVSTVQFWSARQILLRKRNFSGICIWWIIFVL